MGNQKGFALIETLVALAILGSVAVVLLSGLATIIKTNSLIEERTTAESLVRRQIEYVKNAPYQYSITEYAVDPALAIADGWEITPTVLPVHATDDGLQKVTVSVKHTGKTVASVTVYKTYR